MISGNPTEDDKVMFERKRNAFFLTQREVEESYTSKVQDSYNLIWDRINNYVKEYGEKNGYDYIFGANGDGTVMYADGSEDITNDITTYINLRYAGE
jgi:outer membrane protein